MKLTKYEIGTTANETTEEKCRRASLDVGAPACEGCGFVREPLPPWAKDGACFVADGRTWRIIACGSTNRGTRGNLHFHEMVTVEPVEDEPWKLPPRGTTIEQASEDFARLRHMTIFTAKKLREKNAAPVEGNGPQARRLSR